MLSKLTSVVKEIVKDKKTDVFNLEKKLEDIEGKLNDGKIDLVGAMEALRDLFSYKLSNEDYRKIESEVNYNIK